MRITGLDIGNYSIKMIRIKKGLFGVEPIDLEEVRIPRFDNISRGEAIKGSIKEILKRRRIRKGEIVVSLSGHLVSTRIISLPFKDKGKINQVTPFELEGLIPFEIDDLIVDSHIISMDLTGSSLLVAGIERYKLRELLEMLKEIGIEPKAVGADLLGLFNLSRYFLDDQGDSAIIDMGAAKTSVCLVSNKKIKAARSIMLGGDLITEAIRDRFSLTLDEAERIKHEMEGNKDIRGEISEVVRIPLQAILGEIEKTLYIMEGGEMDKISHICLCGGGARLKGMKESVSQRLGIGSIEILKPFAASGHPDSQKDFRYRSDLDGIDEAFAPVLGLLLGRILGKKGCNINLKKGEFIDQEKRSELKVRSIYIGSIIFLLLIVALSNIYIKYRLKEERYQEVRSRIRSIFKEAMPDIKNIVDETAQLKGATEELKKKAGVLIGSEITTLEILDILSEEIPKDITIDVFELVIDQDRIRMDAETDSFESIDRIKGGLKRVPIFKDLVISDAKVGPDQKKVRFRITIALSADRQV